MPTVKLGVDSETYTRLMESAGVERRPVAMQGGGFTVSDMSADWMRWMRNREGMATG